MEESGKKSFVHILRSRAEYAPNRLAFSFARDNDNGEILFDYAQLDLAARRIAVELIKKSFGGGRAVLLYQPGPEYICALAGCWYAGVTAVPVYAPRANASLGRVHTIVANARASVVLTSQKILSSIEESQHIAMAKSGLRMIATDTLDAHEDDWRMPAINEETLAVLQYTSGSTGVPKGVRLTHRHLLVNSRMIHQSVRTNTDSVGVFWLPPYHDMGLIGAILQPFYTGFPTYLMSPTGFLQRPMRWLEALSRHRGTVSAAPNFAFELCAKRVKPEQLPQLDLASWDLVVNGAEPVRADSMRRFAQVFAPAGFRARTFFPSYGMAETTLFVSGISVGNDMRSLRASRDAIANGEIIESAQGVEDMQTIEMVSCGRPNPEIEVRIVDPQTSVECAPGAVGEIWAHGETVADGYWDRPEETEATFRARMVGDERHWLRTGDLGATVDGELFITGRTKDLIIIRGHNHYPHDIEATVLSAHIAIRPGGAAAFALDTEDGEALGLVVELDRNWSSDDPTDVAQAIRDAVSRQHQLQIARLALVKANSVPKTSSGKVQRYLAKQNMIKGLMEEMGKGAVDESLAVG